MTVATGLLIFITLVPAFIICLCDILDKYFVWGVKGEDLYFIRKEDNKHGKN